MRLNRRTALSFALCTAATGLAGTALAQAFPSKPITLVVAYPPGGDTDAMARIYADKLSARLGQPVVVENRPGAGGTVGNRFVSRAEPDGYTLLFTPNPFTSAPMVLGLTPQASYDVLQGFEPVILTGLQSVVLVANPEAGIRSVGDIVAQARAGKALNYGSPGAGSPMHIVAEWLNRAAGIKVQHVPFRGVGPIVPEVLAGRVELGYVTYGAVSSHVRAGRLVAVALTDAQPTPLIPGVPTVAQSGFPDIKLGAWHGIFAPKGTPPAVVALLNSHMNEVLKMADVVERMAAFGAAPVGGEPAALARMNADEYALTSRLIRELGIKAD